MKEITRKTLLYKTGVEYGDYTMNHVLGCSHGCKYPCYAYAMKKRFGVVASYEEWIKPCIVKNTLELLDNEIPRLKNKISSVQLCFATDPFMYGYEEVQQMSLAAIRKLNSAGVKCITLSKGISPKELSNMSNENEYGISIITIDEEFRKIIEPQAAPINDRIDSLLYLHNKGFKTWASIEPYPTPNIIDQNLENILKSISFVDRIVFGKLNYNKEVTSYKNRQDFYNESANTVIDFCERNGIGVYIKKGTIT